MLGLFAGVFADRLDPRRLVMATQAAAMVTATLLALLTLLGSIEPWQVYVLAVVRGIVLVFDAPARQAFTYQMVGPAELPNAVALNSSLFNAARVVGPAIGGVIVAAFGPGFCFAANAVSFLAVLVALEAMRVHDLVPLKRDGARPAIFAGTWEAVRFARRSRRVGIVLALVAVVSTFAFNFNVLLPVLAGETLDAGPEVFGILSATFGAGALAGALLSATIARASFKLLLLGTAGFGVAELVLAPAQTLAVAAACLFVAGLCFTVWSRERQRVAPASRSRCDPRPRARAVLLRLPRLSADRRARLRLAGGRRRHGTRVRCRRHGDARGHRSRARQARGSTASASRAHLYPHLIASFRSPHRSLT